MEKNAPYYIGSILFFFDFMKTDNCVCEYYIKNMRKIKKRRSIFVKYALKNRHFTMNI